ncbi:tyrosine-type recombinase/integrase [Avibacterium avium]|uniref:tyrosine-type recombinase/integrase n=1 Tax=Avibacterium avium TaxID=751 RepID=UPI003BF90AAE
MSRTVKPLTITQVNNAKATDKDVSLADGQGLFLLVKKSGSKLWRFQYYKPFSKKRTLISLGSYPEVSLSDARKKRDNYRKLLAENIDPQDHNIKISQEKLLQQQNTFAAVTKDWLRIKENEVKAGKLKQVTYEDIVKRVNKHLFPLIEHTPINEITAPLMIAKLKPLETEGKLDTLHRVIGYLNNIMIHAVNHSLIKYNPVADIGNVFIKPVAQNNPTIKPDELPLFFDRLYNSKITIDTRCAIEFMLLTAVRVGTVTQMEWAEIDFENGVWEIPKSKMKGRIGKVQDFTAPLSTQALAILKVMKKISGHRKFVFCGTKNVHDHMSKETPNKAIKRIGYQNSLTAHGLRSVFSTAMNEAEFNPEIIEVCLAHFEYSSVRGAYNKAKYLNQRKDYMQWWGDFVENAANGKALFIE